MSQNTSQKKQTFFFKFVASATATAVFGILLLSVYRTYKEKKTVATDGVIKYECAWIQKSESVLPSRLECVRVRNLITARNTLHSMGLIAVYKHNGIGFGNISVRISERSHVFYVSGTQTSHLSNLDCDESCYCVVTRADIDANKLECVGPIKASSESMTHATLYQCSQYIQSVIHVHSPQMWRMYLNQLPTTNPKIEYGTPEMAYEMQRLFTTKYHNKNNNHSGVFVMGGHIDGLIAFGPDVSSTLQLIVDLHNQL